MTDSSGQPIAVLALNPAVDISYEIPQLIADQKVRSAKTRYHPGGNGINVARALRELGASMCCCAVTGGESGSLLLRLLGGSLEGGLRHYEVAGETRLNAVLLQANPPGQYEVDSVGPEIPPEVLWDLKDCFLEACADGLGVLTGSTPPGVPHDIYRELAERIHDQGGRAVVEAHGPVLTQALAAEPYLLRFNLHVLEATVKRRLGRLEAVAEAAREIQRGGVALVCVTLGENGALLVDAKNSRHCSAPKVRVHSTVGCGDAVVAGMVCAAARGESPEAMLRLGVVCGSVTASHAGTELFTRDEVEGAAFDLEIRNLDI
jgi:6-phosphofructokinase 2